MELEPSEEEFKKHFGELLNPPNQPNLLDVGFEECPYIPVLDDPFSIDEIE